MPKGQLRTVRLKAHICVHSTELAVALAAAAASQFDENVIVNAEAEYSMSVLNQLRVLHLATLCQDGTAGNLSQYVECQQELHISMVYYCLINWMSIRVHCELLC